MKGKSLKLKFTIMITLMLFIVILIFSAVIYTINIANSRKPITKSEIMMIAKHDPQIKNYLEKEARFENIRFLGDKLKQYETEKYTNSLIILIPPTLLIAAIISYAISSYLVKPIEEVALNVKTISSSDLSKRIPLKTDSKEIEILINNFNKLLDELDKSFELQEQFIQDAAHELRTPLSSIKTNIDVVLDETSEKQLTITDYEKLIKIIKRLNNKLIKLNEHLLFLNRDHKKNIKLEKTNLSIFINDILESLRYQCKKHNIHIEYKKIGKNFIIQADKELLLQAITNILQNAIKYSSHKKNPKIQIKLFKQNHKSILEIKDNGIGIAQSEISKIFNRFYRGSNALDMSSNGEGLGLSIVKKILNNHNAKIEVESQLHKGTLVRIIFPFQKDI